jgi:hypothetical protein
MWVVNNLWVEKQFFELYAQRSDFEGPDTCPA